MSLNYREKLKLINTFIFDYDGVLSDGSVLMTSNGDALRKSNVKDGYALQLARKKNYRVAIISGGYTEAIYHRLGSLRVTDVFLKVENKLEVFEKYISEHNLKPENILYMGDDIPDLSVMKEVGVPVCPADAAEEVKAASIYISHRNGGEGCVRDVIEQVLKVQGLWLNDDAYHW